MDDTSAGPKPRAGDATPPTPEISIKTLTGAGALILPSPTDQGFTAWLDYGLVSSQTPSYFYVVLDGQIKFYSPGSYQLSVGADGLQVVYQLQGDNEGVALNLRYG